MKFGDYVGMLEKEGFFEGNPESLKDESERDLYGDDIRVYLRAHEGDIETVKLFGVRENLRNSTGGIPFDIIVEYEKLSGGYTPRKRLNGYFDKDGNPCGEYCSAEGAKELKKLLFTTPETPL